MDHYGNILPPGAIGRIGNLRFSGGARHIIALAHGELVLNGRSLCWVNATTGEVCHANHPHKSRVLTLAPSLSGDYLASGSEDGVLTLWDARGARLGQWSLDFPPRGKKRRDFNRQRLESIVGLGLFAEGAKLAVALRRGTLIVWDIENQAILTEQRLAKQGACNMVVSSAMGIACICFDDGTLATYDLETGRCLWTHAGDGCGDFALAVSAAGNDFASGTRDGLICFWDAISGNLIHQQRGPGNGTVGVTALAFSPDGSSFAVAGAVGPIEIYGTVPKIKLATLPLIGEPSCLCFSCDSKRLFACVDSGLYSWETATGREFFRVEGPPNICDMALCQGGRSVVLAHLSSAGFWDIHSGRALKCLGVPCERIALTADTKRLACAALDNPLRVWDLETGRIIASFRAQNDISSLAFSPDGNLLVSGDPDYDNGSRIMVWDIATGKLHHAVHAEPWQSIEENPKMLDDETQSLEDWDAKCLALSPDGGLLASAGMTGIGQHTLIRLWNFPGLARWRDLEGHDGYIAALSFSANGQILASAGADKIIIIWDLKRGKPMFTLAGHSGTVTTIAFSQDGRFLVSGSVDHTIRLWDMSARQEVKIFQGHSEAIKRVLFHPSDNTLLSAALDTTVLIWDLTSRWRGDPRGDPGHSGNAVDERGR